MTVSLSKDLVFTGTDADNRDYESLEVLKCFASSLRVPIVAAFLFLISAAAVLLFFWLSFGVLRLELDSRHYVEEELASREYAAENLGRNSRARSASRIPTEFYASRNHEHRVKHEAEESVIRGKWRRRRSLHGLV